MDPNDLSTKLAAAKVAMTGNKSTYSQALAALRQKNLSPNPDLEITPDSNDLTVLAKRRAEARKAMETAEQRQRRLENEKKIAEDELTQKRIEELRRARLALEQKRLTESSSTEALMAKKKAEEERIYNQKIEAAKVKIEEIAKTPTAGPRNIRTLTNDLAHEINNPDFSVAKTLINQRKNNTAPTVESNNKNSLLIIIAFCLIVGGISALTLSYYWTTRTTSTVPPLTLNQLVFTDVATKIDIDQKSSTDIITEINNRRRDNDNSLNNIFLLVNSTSTGTRPLNRTSWFNLFSIKTPISFNHFLIDESNFGISNYGTSSVWFILKTRSYEQTFDALLREGKNIIPALYRPFVTPNEIASFQQAQTREAIIENIDVQIWQTASSTTLIYGFLDKETLLIAQNEQTFTKLLNNYLVKR